MKILTEEEQAARVEAERNQYLRDQYAGQAMRGILAAGGRVTMPTGGPGNTRVIDDTTRHVVTRAWNIAEAMLKERAARQNQTAQ